MYTHAISAKSHVLPKCKTIDYSLATSRMNEIFLRYLHLKVWLHNGSSANSIVTSPRQGYDLNRAVRESRMYVRNTGWSLQCRASHSNTCTRSTICV